MTPMDTEARRIDTAFHAAFGHAPMLLVRAPGRVNLIGEHTDYNDGFVLPCAIDRATTVAISPARGSTTTIVAADYEGARDSFAIDAPIAHRPEVEWAAHGRAIHAAFRARGLALPATEIVIGGNVPQGAGLSSSASLGVALARALAAIGGHYELTPTDLALIAQSAENDFVGVACGIMDQLASARSVAGHALLIDCRSLAATPIALPADVAVVIVHSGIERGLVGSAYNERRQQCEAAARHYGVVALRDLDEAALVAGAAGLNPVAFRRARHVVSENARTLAAADALKSGDLRHLGGLFAASHASMRDDFEITLPAIDRLVAIAAQAIGGHGGARMTGGGFGGCIVAVTTHGRAADVVAAVQADYRTPAGTVPLVFEITAADGVSVLDRRAA